MSQESGFQTIVVATDFSDHAASAVAVGAEIAKQHGARVVLVHAVMAMTPTAPEFIPVPASFYEELRTLAHSQLEALAQPLRQQGLNAEARIMAEPAVSAVLAAVEDRQADLVVVGTRGMSGVKRLLLGSTAARLIREAPCPVLTVPVEAQTTLRKALVATDFSDHAAAAAAAAARLLGRDEAEPRQLVLLHAYRYPSALSHLDGAALVDAISATDEAARGRLAALAESLARPGLRIEIRAEPGEPAETILERAGDLGADLVAMGTHGRSALKRLFLGSNTERVLPSASCPVLTVHLPASAQTARM